MTAFKPIYGAFIAVAALVIIGGAIWYLKNTGTAVVADATQEQVTNTTATDTTSGDASGSTSTSPYKDGTYTAMSTYQTPETTEPLTVTLTLKDGVVTDATVVGDPQVPETRRYQGIFIANYKQYVIGKNIGTLSLSQVSGSSLTSSGFNAAVAQIKAQAQS